MGIFIIVSKENNIFLTIMNHFSFCIVTYKFFLGDFDFGILPGDVKRTGMFYA